MSTGKQPIVVHGTQWPSLLAALRLDTAEDELVKFVCGKLEIPEDDTSKLLGEPSPFVALVETLWEDYASLRSLRVLEEEYQRLIAESHQPGRVVLNLIPLWVIDTRTGKLTHEQGYLVDSYRGGSYLIHDGQSFALKRGGEGYNDIVFTSATAAADWLTRWTDSARKKLQQAYGALETLAEEVKPPKPKR